MSKHYSEEDVARWDAATRASIELHRRKLAEAGIPTQKQDFHLGMLSLAHKSMGMTRIAQQKFGEARQCFKESIKVLCTMYERLKAGIGRPLEAGHFQSILVAVATCDATTTDHLVQYYQSELGTPDSIFLGSALKLIVTGELDRARISLTRKKPRFESQFIGYPGCLEAIALKDQARFVTSLNVATDSWAKWASRTVRGLPDSVCFVQGAGLVLLGEKHFGQLPGTGFCHIPDPLLRP